MFDMSTNQRPNLIYTSPNQDRVIERAHEAALIIESLIDIIHDLDEKLDHVNNELIGAREDRAAAEDSKGGNKLGRD